MICVPWWLMLAGLLVLAVLSVLLFLKLVEWLLARAWWPASGRRR